MDEPYWKDLTIIPGIGTDKAVTICAAIELGRRLSGRFIKEIYRILTLRIKWQIILWKCLGMRVRNICMLVI